LPVVFYEKNNNMYYFEVVTDASVYSTKRPPAVENLNVMTNIGSGSKWAVNELFAARVVIRTARPDRQFGHLLPILRNHSDRVLAARRQPSIQALLGVPEQLGQHQSMTETELVHLYGASLGSFWATLARFGDVEGLNMDVDSGDDGDDGAGIHGDVLSTDDGEGDCMNMGVGEGEKRPYSSSSDQSVSALPIRSKRVRTAPDRTEFVDITKTQIESSSPQRSSQQASQGSDTVFVSESHSLADVPEQATLEIASTFIRHVLWASPPQDDTRNHKPPYLVEFSGVSREFSGKTATNEQIRATADGELVLYRLDDSNHYQRTGHRPALLEAKKRFAVIKDGRPLLTNGLLGQMTCEALALRIQQTKDTNQADEQ
jgi:hypothetical protein